MKILIAIKTCHTMRSRANCQRATWITQLKNADLRFFLGTGSLARLKDEVHLDVDDSYLGLPYKSRGIARWALEAGYDYVFMTDDDTYVQPDRLLSSGFQDWDYVGRLRGPSGNYPAPYNSGMGYWLSRRSLEAIATAEITDTAEDRHAGNTLLAAGISGHGDYRYQVIRGHRNAPSGKEGPRVGNDVIAAGEVEEWEFPNIHEQWLKTPSKTISGPSKSQPFSNLTIAVKTFLRDGYLFKTVAGIEQAFPGIQIILVDCGRESRKKVTWYSELRSRGHKTLWLPFDAGFCRMSNTAVKVLDRPYLLIASDDFEMNASYVRPGVEKMLAVLEARSDVGVASGRVDFNDYACHIDRTVPGVIREVPLSPSDYQSLDDGTEYAICGLTVNYGIVRREVFHPLDGSIGVRWFPEYPIGGDHFPLYDKITKAGWLVAQVKDAEVRQYPLNGRLQDPEYPKYRGRAKDALPQFFKEYSLTEYIMSDGSADFLKADGSVGHRSPPKQPDKPLPLTGHPADRVFIAPGRTRENK